MHGDIWKRIGLSCTVLLFACVVSASIRQGSVPEYLVDVWQVEDGLPHNTVTCVTQTRDGYLWLGTYNGLARFDGARFVVFGAHNTPGIRGNRILTILADRQDRLWFGTEGGGLTCLEAGLFVTLTVFDGLPNNIVHCLSQDADGRVWIGTHAGLCCLENGKLSTVKDVHGTVHATACDSDGNAWFLVDNSLYVCPPGHFRVTRFDRIEPQPLSSLHTTRSGKVWLISRTSLLPLGVSPGAMTASEVVLPFDASVALDSANGDIWIGDRESGLRRRRTERWLTVPVPRDVHPQGLHSLYEDREGNLWIGTGGAGLLRLKPRRLTTLGASDGLAGDAVLSMAEEGEGGVWISTRRGIFRYDNGTVTPWTAGGAIPNDMAVGPLLRTRDGSLWIGTSGKGLFQWRNGHVKSYGRTEGLPDTTILALYENHAGGLWIGTYDAGLFLYQDGGFRRFTAADGFPAQIVTAITEDEDGDLWIGSDGMGLYRYANGRFSYFCRREGWGNDFIKALCVDANGALWIGSGCGLTRMKDGWFATLTTKHGLIDDVVMQILEGKDGRLWLGTNRGICRLDKAAFETFADGRSASVGVVAYGKSDGMLSLECTGGLSPSAVKMSDGALWFPTAMGIVCFDPRTLDNSAAAPPPVIIEEARIDDRRATNHADGLSYVPSLRLLPGEERLEIRYTAPSFAAPERVRFRYRLVGLDSHWIEVGNERSARFTKLPPGEYRFEVTARGNRGGWNREGAALSVRVVPHLWQTRWFPWTAGFMAAVALAGAVRTLVVRRMRAKLDRMRRRHALEEERGRIARNIHDDLGARLTRISLLSSLAEQDQGEPTRTAEHVAEIADAVRGVTGALDEVVWAVDPGNDTLENLATYICHYAEEFISETDLRLRFSVSPILPNIPLSSAIRHDVFLIVKEALNNVVKHSVASTVRLGLTYDEGYVEICIEDDGIGFDRATVERGNGLNNMTTRVGDLQGSICFEGRPGKGCRVVCRIPIA